MSAHVHPVMLAKSEAWLLERAYIAASDADREQAIHIRATIIAYRSGEWRLTGKRPQVPASAVAWLVDLAWNGDTRAKTLIQWLHGELLLSLRDEYSMMFSRRTA